MKCGKTTTNIMLISIHKMSSDSKCSLIEQMFSILTDSKYFLKCALVFKLCSVLHARCPSTL